MKHKKSFKVIIILVILGVIIFVGFKWLKILTFETMINKASKELSEVIVQKSEQADYAQKADCSFASDISHLTSKGWREWTENITVTLWAEDSFDLLSDENQYNFLEQMKDETLSVREEFLNSFYPNYLHYYEKWYYLDDIYKDTVFTRRDLSVVLYTSSNTYESSTLKNSYKKNSKEIFLDDFDWNDAFSNVSVSSETVSNNSRHTNSEAWSCAKNIVKSNLKSPSTASFCSFPQAKVTHLGNGEYMVSGWVDAQNSFGAKIRENFVVTYTATPKGYKNGTVVFD